MSSTPYRVPEADSRNNIGKAVRVVGQIFTKEDLYVDGDVEGTIESQDNKLTIGPNGRVRRGSIIPGFQLSLFDRLSGLVRLTSSLGLPFGLSLFTVAQKPDAR